ncbi:UPF0029-domain-containing protein [Morchella conica CCBAS932]|uniref:UPF0029-domain-containing protein n=2 Tax=Morchella sect. Distantes TaxID=1051054 RepID=A0A3N4KQ39_9PEZI|nr:UPF0029-domain-containing protein [Morchella conica CCBAS932]
MNSLFTLRVVLKSLKYQPAAHFRGRGADQLQLRRLPQYYTYTTARSYPTQPSQQPTTNLLAMNEDLAEEIEVLNSIYGGECIASTGSGSVYVLRPPESTISPPLSLTLSFPENYPHAPPVVVDGAGGGKSGVEGKNELARDVLSAVWREGEVCLFDLVEGMRELLEAAPPPAAVEEVEVDDGEEGYREWSPPPTMNEAGQHTSEHEWIVADPIVEKKSVFVGRAIEVHSVEDAKRYIADLIAGDKKIAKATHNMTAYRIQRENGVTFQDNDDDGETAAGGRMGHLLQVMDVSNVLVVVSRWYGGVKLGPDRFRLINTAAREALVKGGFVKTAETSTGNSGKAKAKDKKAKK